MKTVKLKKPKVAEARVVGLSKATKNNGGTTAPPGAARGPTTGLTGNKAIDPNHPNYVPKPASGNAGSTSGGGPTAPSPSPAPSAGPPETPGSITGRAGSEALHAESLKTDAYKKYLAALAYGDPGQINYWGKIAAEKGATGISQVQEGAGNLGQLLDIEKEEGKNQLANKFAHTGTNTFRSGFMLNDVNQIGEQAQKAKTDAWNQLQTALNELQEAENEANNTFAQEIGGWDEKDREAALENEPGGEDEPPSPNDTPEQTEQKKKKNKSKSKNGNAVGPGHPVGPAISKGHKAK